MEQRSPTARGRQDTGGWWRAEGATTRHLSPQRAAALRGSRRAFTLTELLIVIGLIVLVIALAVPAFRAMTGGRSIDAAQNQLAAVLGAARAEAIGLQKVRGVFFYLDPATDRVNAVLVQDAGTELTTDPPDWMPDLFLDLVPDRDPIALPVGVGVQGIDDSNMDTSVSPPRRRDDGYVGYNNVIAGYVEGSLPANPVRFGGAILFDGYGRVVQKYYGCLLGRRVLASGSRTLQPTRIGELLGYTPGTEPPEWLVPKQNLGGSHPANDSPPRSLFGFVLYDAEPFRGSGHTDGDPQLRDTTAGNYSQNSNEFKEEEWLDENAFPVLINRYNGTLVRGE